MPDYSDYREPTEDQDEAAPTASVAFDHARILIVDDEEPNVRLLERVLSRAGFDDLVATTDSREA